MHNDIIAADATFRDNRGFPSRFSLSLSVEFSPWSIMITPLWPRNSTARSIIPYRGEYKTETRVLCTFSRVDKILIALLRGRISKRYHRISPARCQRCLHPANGIDWILPECRTAFTDLYTTRRRFCDAPDNLALRSVNLVQDSLPRFPQKLHLSSAAWYVRYCTQFPILVGRNRSFSSSLPPLPGRHLVWNVDTTETYI